MTTHAPAPSGGGKGGLKTVMGTIVLLIIVLFAISKCGGGKGNGTASTPQGPAAVQTGPAQQPAQAAPVATDPCSTQAPRTVTAPTGTARSPWVSLPTGSCLAQSSAGRYVTYGVECLGTDGNTYADGVCKGYAAAERYYSKGASPVEVTMTAVYRPPT